MAAAYYYMRKPMQMDNNIKYTAALYSTMMLYKQKHSVCGSSRRRRRQFPSLLYFACTKCLGKQNQN